MCASDVRELGGIVDNSITLKTDYLVVGTQADDKWKYVNKGGKIEKAMTYRNRDDCAIKIVSGIAFAVWLKAAKEGRAPEAMLDRLESLYWLHAE